VSGDGVWPVEMLYEGEDGVWPVEHAVLLYDRGCMGKDGSVACGVQGAHVVKVRGVASRSCYGGSQ
jgi:hypothetical protein